VNTPVNTPKGDLARIFEVIDGTWPAARYQTCGPFTLRVGQGGGNRVSAATQNAPFTADDLPAAEDAMRAIGQDPLFMIRPNDSALDAALAARGYAIRDEVMIYTCPTDRLCDRPLPRVTVFSIWQPLAIMVEIWAKGGIGPGRLAVMNRAHGPKTGLLARQNEKPGGAAYVAIHDGIAMVHALEILPHQRAQGLGGWMMRGAALWAAAQGARRFSVICTTANTGANALYRSLGMDAVGTYHYRYIPKEGDQS
jgi:GNAT superfamily N-acetyltransferase